MNAELLEQHAREKAGQGPDWCAWRWECYPRGNHPTLFYQLTGAVAPLVLKGRRKGRRDWKRKDESTGRVVIITPADQEAYEAAWEARTGRCSGCGGNGRRVASASVSEGTTYRPCPRCKGSGRIGGEPGDRAVREVLEGQAAGAAEAVAPGEESR